MIFLAQLKKNRLYSAQVQCQALVSLSLKTMTLKCPLKNEVLIWIDWSSWLPTENNVKVKQELWRLWKGAMTLTLCYMHLTHLVPSGSFGWTLTHLAWRENNSDFNRQSKEMLGSGSGLQGALAVDSSTTVSVAARLVDVTEQTWMLLHQTRINSGIQWHQLPLSFCMKLQKPELHGFSWGREN